MINNISGLAQFTLSRLREGRFHDPVMIDLSTGFKMIIVPRPRPVRASDLLTYNSLDTKGIHSFKDVIQALYEDGDTLFCKFTEYDEWIGRTHHPLDLMAMKINKLAKGPDAYLDVCTTVTDVWFPPNPMRVEEEILTFILECVITYEVMANMSLISSKPMKPFVAVYRSRQSRGAMIDLSPKDFLEAYTNTLLPVPKTSQRELFKETLLIHICNFLFELDKYSLASSHSTYFSFSSDPIINEITWIALSEELERDLQEPIVADDVMEIDILEIIKMQKFDEEVQKISLTAAGYTGHPFHDLREGVLGTLATSLNLMRRVSIAIQNILKEDTKDDQSEEKNPSDQSLEDIFLKTMGFKEEKKTDSIKPHRRHLAL